jgi:tight adherence protein C
MSNSVLVILSLGGTFGAVAIAGIAVALGRAERAHTTQLLQSQVVLPGPDLRKQDVARPLTEGALLPFVSGIGTVARRVTPIDMRRRITKKLVLAGNPEGWDAERVAALKLVGMAVGAGLGFLLARQLSFTGLKLIGFMVILTFAGYIAPDTVITRKAGDRQKAILRALPDTMDLLTISVEAGLGFDAALAQVVQHVPGPLSQELARMLQEVQLGRTRTDAFRDLGERSNLDEMKGFVLAMIQANIFGVSVSKVLRGQAAELRSKRRQNAERIAMQIPVKILFPMLFCIMPALFTVVIGPGAIRIFHSFTGV